MIGQSQRLLTQQVGMFAYVTTPFLGVGPGDEAKQHE